MFRTAFMPLMPVIIGDKPISFLVVIASISFFFYNFVRHYRRADGPMIQLATDERTLSNKAYDER